MDACFIFFYDNKMDEGNAGLNMYVLRFLTLQAISKIYPPSDITSGSVHPLMVDGR